MKQTKQFKRTAFPLSAKSMVSLMLLLVAMLVPQGAWAANHYDAGYGSTATTYSAAGIKFKITAVRMYNYQGNNSHFNSNPLVTITAGEHTHTFNLGSLTGESGNSIFYYNGEGNENPYKGSGSFSKRTYEQTVDGIPVKAYFDNQKNEQRVSTNPDKTYKDNGDGSSKWCTADLTIEIGVQTAATVTIAGNWRDESDGINKTETYSWPFDIPMHSHVYGSYSSNNDATCTDDGTKSRWCDYCGAEDKVTDKGSALGHNLTATVAKAVTCTTAGNNAYWTCSTCKKVFSNSTATTETTVAAQTIKALGHGSADYTESYSWTGNAYNDESKDTKKCTFTLTCNKCSTKVVNEASLTCTKTAHDDASCTETGSTTYQATGSYTAANSAYNYSKTVTNVYTVAALGHGSTGYTSTYTWGGRYDDATCTFKLECGLCGGEVFNDNITTSKVQAYHVDATCTNGNERWTATGSYSKAGDAPYNGTAQVNDYAIPAVHTFDDVTDPHHTLCTICDHSFFRYTASERVVPAKNTLRGGAGNNIYVDTQNIFADDKGVMEFNEPLVTIGEDAFNLSKLAGSLIIPNTVTTIVDGAFYQCRGLTGDLAIPNSVTSIGKLAFCNCTGFNGKLTISDKITEIPYGAFADCRFTSVIIPKSVTIIGVEAFGQWMGSRYTSIEMQCVPLFGKDPFFNVNCPKTVVLSDNSYVYKESNPYFPGVASVTAPCTLDLTGSAVEYHANLTRTHNYTEESDADAYLASAASCSTDATYFYKCANCTEHNSETWTKAGTRGHHYVDGHCSVCGDASGPMTVTLENGEVIKYNSLQEAINDIVGLFGGYDITLTLHQDLTIEDIEIIFHERGDNFNFTLDLNGHTITGSREERCNYFDINNSESGLPTLTIANSCQDKKGKLFNCRLDLNKNTKVIVSEGVSIYPKFENTHLTSSIVHLDSETSSLVNYGDIYGIVNVGPGASFINNGRVAYVNGEFENNGGYCAYFNWADDGSSFSAFVGTGIYDYNEEDEEYSITSEVTKEPTCSEPGVRTFTGTFIGDPGFGPQEFTDTKEVEIPTLDHTFAASDLTHDVCTVCNHGFLRYESYSQQNPFNAANLKDKGDNTLEIVSHTFDEDNNQGVMEFNAPLVTIGDHAFFASDISGITIPNTVTTIGDEAFSETDLTSINIPNSVETIGNSAFSGCIDFLTITLGTSVKEIGSDAFFNVGGPDITLKSLPQFTAPGGYAATFYDNVSFDDEYYAKRESTRTVKRRIIKNIPYSADFSFEDDSYVATGSYLSYECVDLASYTRTGIKNQWGTIVVPFMVNGSGDVYDLYTLTQVSDDELTLTKVGGTLNAGTPALIRINSELVGDGKTYDLTLTAASNAVSGQLADGSEADGLTLTGSYEVKDITGEDGYIISNNKFWSIQDINGNGDNDVYCAPFRAYLAGTPSSDAKALSISISEEADAMEAITAITEGEAEYFDLNGRKLNSLQTGVNIVKYSNGKTKKVIVK